MLEKLLQLDRRLIYLFVAVSLSIPLILEWRLPPAPMPTADRFFEVVEQLEPSPEKIVLIASDWGPGTQAENREQTKIAIEHLMRKRIPFAMISVYTLATPFLEEVPREVAKRLSAEHDGQTWEYGKDWVNFGFQPGGYLMVEGLAKAKNWHEHLKTDVNGTPLEDIEVMKGVKSIRNVELLMEFTGLVGVFNYWLQFFQVEGYSPKFVHGCTSITIPKPTSTSLQSKLLDFMKESLVLPGMTNCSAKDFLAALKARLA